MPTPDIILFSPLKLSTRAAVHALAPVLQRCELELREVSRLGWDPGENLFQCVGSDVSCSDEHDALRIAAHWWGFVLSYDCAASLQRIYFYHWNIEGKAFASVQISPQVLTFASTKWPRGKWFRSFIYEIVSTMQADVAAYGWPYDDFLKSVDVLTAVGRLKSGELQKRPTPHIHLVALPLVTSEDVRRIVEVDKTLTYSVTATGYHVFSDLEDDGLTRARGRRPEGC